jgi:hypothetical protein
VRGEKPGEFTGDSGEIPELRGQEAVRSTIAAKRVSQADSFGYLGFDIKAPLMHLTSGELVELITADTYWPKFRAYFRGNTTEGYLD